VTPEQLALAIRNALKDAVAAGELAVDVPDEVRVERPRNREHGDWSTNISLQLAKGAGIPPREVATHLADRLSPHQAQRLRVLAASDPPLTPAVQSPSGSS